MSNIPKKPWVRYAIWLRGNRGGEFEFLCSSQRNWTSSLEGAQQELKDLNDELSSYGGDADAVLYKLTVEKL